MALSVETLEILKTDFYITEDETTAAIESMEKTHGTRLVFSHLIRGAWNKHKYGHMNTPAEIQAYRDKVLALPIPGIVR